MQDEIIKVHYAKIEMQRAEKAVHVCNLRTPLYFVKINVLILYKRGRPQFHNSRPHGLEVIY
jgi:hypothetical protein